MADVVMGAMGSLIPKLLKLLKEEYKLQSDAKERIKSLTVELEAAQAALRKVAQVPWDQLDEQVKLWAREVRESSYDMEDVLDTYIVQVQHRDSNKESSSLAKRLGEKMVTLFNKSKARRKISIGVKDIMSHLDEVTARCRRYKVDDIVARPSTASAVDPRLAAMYNKVNNLVGIHKSSGDLISMLQLPSPKMKIASVVGVGGLGKTTLAKAVHDKVKGDFARSAFVTVGRNPDLTKVIQGILIELDRQTYMQFNFGLFHQLNQFIKELRKFLHENKRYFIVIDDIWEVKSWETIRLAFDDDNSCGGRVLITTRKLDVATKANEVYKLPPLPYASSKQLFYSRISGDEGNFVDNNQPDKVSDKILKKCGGIPLAIITMASLLVGKPRDRWSEIYKSVSFGQIDNNEEENTIMKILSFSYYDLPSHLRTCLLYLSAFPEDSFIPKMSLVWKWVAEGFVHEVQGLSLFEVGEGYFNDLINRSLIQEAVKWPDEQWLLYGCHVHDMVLDFIRSMSREENFCIFLDNSNQVTLLQSNVRRLAIHNRAMGQTHHQANHFDGMPKVRSFSAHGCVIEKWAVSLSSFTLLRVLALENCSTTGDSLIHIEQVGHLLHLRYLSLYDTNIDKVPEEIGALKWLQTLDLRKSCLFIEPLSNISLLTQVMCLRIELSIMLFSNSEAVCLERLTSLEELEIKAKGTETWHVKDLGSLRELRVLKAEFIYNEETERELVESLRHLHKLQHLSIVNYSGSKFYWCATWEAAGFILPRNLRLLATHRVVFSKLPSCIKPWCLRNLSHLNLNLKKVDEQDLKILGGLPELHYLQLFLWSSATICNTVSDSDDVVYFPKLRCWRLPFSMMVLFLGNKEDTGASFHLWWEGEDDIAMPSAVADESQRPIASDSGVGELDRPMKLHRGLVPLIYCYFLAFFQHVLAFVRKWSLFRQVSQHLLISTCGSGSGNGEGAIATPSASVDENKGSISSNDDTATPRFMPSLQKLHFLAHIQAVRDHRYCNNLGLEYLPSLREISVEILIPRDASDAEVERMEAALRCAADFHPNRPTLHMEKLDYRRYR
ncbi:unnamed protein product [Urochloa decumbens]|uniref:AAA+ ATPase domain-containing protein n=1 Tax=Urochloa decumbens TaxID=240449 RepID=A0ABC9H6U9_9POAL